MLTKGDITDIISEHLAKRAGAAGSPARAPARASAPLPKRVFITDWEMKRLVKPGSRTVKLPANAIVSPLSQDWLDYDGIELVRE